MTRLLAVALTALCCCAALAMPVIDGSAGDPLYGGAALSVQDTQTGYGDANLGRPDVCNGSELDGAYGVVYNGKLYLVFAGNFETNNNKLNIFFDTRTGGQNRLLATNSGPDVYGGLRRMSDNGDPNLPGLTFQSGFEADFWVSVGCFGDPVGIFVDYAELYVDALNPGVFYFVGTGQAKCQTNGGALTPDPNSPDPNALPAILVTVDNSNRAGVTGGETSDNGSGVTTGIELAIPLSALGNPTGTIAITAFITDPVAANVSNQFLGGLLASPNLGESRAVNLSLNMFHAPFTVPITTPIGACCHGATCAIMTQAACTPGGGVYKGDNTSCDGNPCTPLVYGRCCVDDGYAGLCYVVENAAECTALSPIGIFTPNETCAGCPCLLPPKGACCVGNTCTVEYETTCLGLSGNYRGNYTNCDSLPCEQGACCLGLVCTDERRFECSDPLAVFYAGVTCLVDKPCGAPTIAVPYVAGDFNGWTNPDPNYLMVETDPNSRIWTKLISGLVAGSRHEFKVTDGTWAKTVPASPGPNSWFFADPNGQCIVTYNSNFVGDDWAPARDRLGLSADPGAWNAPGNYVAALGGLNWTNNDPHSAMVPQGGGIHKLTFTGVPAGNYLWKAVVSGSWDSISWNTRSVNTADMAFTIGAPTDTVDLWVDNTIGVVKVDVTPGAVSGACCLPNGHCVYETEVECLQITGGVFHPGVTCGTVLPTAYHWEYPLSASLPPGLPFQNQETGEDSTPIGKIRIDLKIIGILGPLHITVEHYGTTVVLWDGVCQTSSGMDVVFDDDGVPVNCADLNNPGTPITPASAGGGHLSDFRGMEFGGPWIIHVYVGGQEVLILVRWSLWVQFLDDDFVCVQVPTGACCLPNGSCIHTSQATCLGQGGTEWHYAVPCSFVVCPQPNPTGACCSANGTCSVITQAACTGAGGHYYGNSTTCRPGNKCPASCRGDMNCDGQVTFADIDLFVAALAGEPAWTHWPCPWINGDCTADGNVTFADIDPFVARIGHPCP